MTLNLALQILGTGFGLLGTWLLHKPGRWAPWGFACWLVSNPAAMTLMAIQGNWLMVLQFTIYWLIAMSSVWHWLIKPRWRRT